MKKVMIFAIFLVGMVASAQTSTAAATKATTSTATTTAKTSTATSSSVKKVHNGAATVEKTSDQVAPMTGNNKMVKTTKTSSKAVKDATAQ